MVGACPSSRHTRLTRPSYNIEHLTALVRAAEAKRSPLILLLFPSTVTQLPTLAWAAAAAVKSATVPLSLHLDHAQDEEQIRHVAERLPFDSIMVDMSHHDHVENLEKTKNLTHICHARGIAVEAESGRINGGEDGIAHTGDLEGQSAKPSRRCRSVPLTLPTQRFSRPPHRSRTLSLRALTCWRRAWVISTAIMTREVPSWTWTDWRPSTGRLLGASSWRSMARMTSRPI